MLGLYLFLILFIALTVFFVHSYKKRGFVNLKTLLLAFASMAVLIILAGIVGKQIDFGPVLAMAPAFDRLSH